MGKSEYAGSMLQSAQTSQLTSLILEEFPTGLTTDFQGQAIQLKGKSQHGKIQSFSGYQVKNPYKDRETLKQEEETEKKQEAMKIRKERAISN
jgi:hypothetical protein